MDINTAIKKRRSIRKYTNNIPEDEIINKILESAIWAPSGLNNQPWKFKIIKEKNDRNKLASFTKYGHMLSGAPITICVFLDKNASYDREKDIMAIGACIQNMLLRVEELGLAACWLGEILNKKTQVEKYLNTDKTLELMAAIVIGYPNEKGRGERKDLLKFII